MFYLMERGTRYVYIPAEMTATVELLIKCILNQGGTPTSRDNFPIDFSVKAWLLAEVIEPVNSPFLIPVAGKETIAEDLGADLLFIKKSVLPEKWFFCRLNNRSLMMNNCVEVLKIVGLNGAWRFLGMNLHQAITKA